MIDVQVGEQHGMQVGDLGTHPLEGLRGAGAEIDEEAGAVSLAQQVAAAGTLVGQFRAAGAEHDEVEIGAGAVGSRGGSRGWRRGWRRGGRCAGGLGWYHHQGWQQHEGMGEGACERMGDGAQGGAGSEGVRHGGRIRTGRRKRITVGLAALL